MAFLFNWLSSPFDQPVGATADLKELEYISALLQTGKSLRSDGSLRVEDISLYLMSRHGLRVSPRCVNDTIFQVFGVDDEAEEEILDLVELTGILIIPILLIMRKGVVQSERKSNSKVGAVLGEDAIKTQTKQQRLLGDPKDILRNILSMMYTDSGIKLNSAEDYPRLTEGLVRQLLRSYGMHYLAQNDDFISQMLIAAKGKSTSDDIKLNEATFAKALTNDVKLFKNKSFDVDDLCVIKTAVETKHSSKNCDKTPEDELNFIVDEEVGTKKNLPSRVSWQNAVFTANTIDFIADTYPSMYFVVCLWVCFLLFFYSYVGTDFTVRPCESDSAACRIANSVASWLALATTLMLSGLLFIGLGSVGFIPCSIIVVSKLLGIVAMGTIGLFTIFPFFYETDWLSFNTLNDNTDLTYVIARYLAIIIGCVLILQQILHFISAKGQMLRRIIETSHSAGKNINKAAVFKLARMVQNAQNLHTSWKEEKEMGGSYTCFGRALLQFSKQSHDSEKFSLTRAWSHVCNGKFFREEGLWLSSRLISGVFIQLFAVCFFCIYVTQSVQELITIDQPTYNCTLHDQSYYLSACPFDTVGSCYTNCTTTPGAHWFEKSLCRLNCNEICDPCQPTAFLPLWSYKVSLFVSLFLTAASLLFQALNYIPSYIKSTLKFRTGAHPSLGDSYFEDYRIQAALGCNLTGAMFFGVLISGTVIASLLLIVILFFVAPVFRDAVVTVLIIVAGFAINVAIKVTLTMIYRLQCFASFYRRHPAIANIVGLMLECWNIALAAGFVLIRAIKLIFTSAFFIGRIDIPMLHIHGRLKPWSVDLYPMIFRADILAHEAHRHPYIETLGLVYLYKLRYQEFANAAGSTWRILFVMTLFPWLRKYSFRRKCIEPERKDDVTDENDDMTASILSLKEDVKVKAGMLMKEDE